MKAGETSFLKLMNGVQQFIVPIYQRTYSWEIRQCSQLWKDIINVTQYSDNRVHFIGSIVYIDLGTPKGRPQQMLLIDGQQRITTLSLIFIALHRYVIEKHLEEELTPSKIKNYYLFNSEETGSNRIKLLLTEQDKATYNALLLGTEKTLMEPSERMIENFNYFKKLIENSNIPVSTIYEGIDSRLMLVAISLDKTQDNPQLIFESMNSTGKDLTQADLMRNFILMGVSPDEQENLYTTYWRPMEVSFGQKGYEQYFDFFARDFLTSQNGNICRIDEVYDEFKKFYKLEQTKEKTLVDLHTYSKYYVRMHLGIQHDNELDRLWFECRQLGVTVFYPFFMRLFHDYEHELLTKPEFIAIIKATISYVVRRSVCEVPTNSMNKTFATFYSKVDKSNYLNSVLVEYVIKDSYRGFPTDEEFVSKFITKSIYTMFSRNYLLESLENFDHKEKINITNNGYTIEHIMPQNPELSKEWKTMLGTNWQEIQQTYLHTIGNLTLTKYNSELSDSSFETKKTIKGGFKDSHLRLNNKLSELDNWNELEMKNRAIELAKEAISIWGYPQVEQKEVNKYRTLISGGNEYDLAHHKQMMSEKTFAMYEEFDRKIHSLDPSIQKEYKKWYIAYKVDTNFVDFETCKNYFNLSLNMPFEEIYDPKGICIDVTDVWHTGNGSVKVRFDQKSDQDYILELIKQSLERQISSESEN